jgi:pSer/pThr/pTyr-binding forkhead associated (FHA) protein
MTNQPAIMVQLVHIKGPLQGEIQDFIETEILIGRHSSCHVRFPKDLALISRKHARILREGNRFKLIDQSANGTFLNGKRVQEAYLKDGDVLIFAEGGPKVSFLTKIVEGQPEVQPQPPRAQPAVPVPPAPSKPVYEKSPQPAEITPPPPKPPAMKPAKEQTFERRKVPLVIQYGPTLRSFKELPVTIGKSPGCDFILDHPAVLERHAQIFYSQEQYWVKDLTGQNRVLINRQPIHIQAPLQAENRLSLSSRGPSFRFLGAGRLAEIEEPVPERPQISSSGPRPEEPPKMSPRKSKKGTGEVIKKFFKR